MKGKKLNELFLFIIGSLAFLALPVLFSPDFSFDLKFISIAPFQKEFVLYTLLLLFFYLNYFVLVPRLYFAKRYFYFVSIIVISFLIISLLPGIIVTEPPFHFHSTPFVHFPPPSHSQFWIHDTSRNLLPFMIVMLLSLVLRIYSLWKQSEREKTETELSYLKAQINPHFLFNTLNSIYSLSIQEKATSTSDSIVELSSMMRYVLNESKNEYVSLEKEMSYIESFIKLQKLRFSGTLDLLFKISGDMKGKRIAPVILIPFIENAFKYGVNPEHPSKIYIEIIVDENVLVLKVENNKVNPTAMSNENHGIGIENTKNRLILLYPNRFKLLINDQDKEYKVSLTIQL